ncbi:MAG TPA: DUF4262 domain-containing protein [Acidimicrobiia bacterium]|jgi:hypothetical protein
MDARTQAWIDQSDAWLADTVRRHRWAIRYVGGEACAVPGCDCPQDDGPSFAYTIGLFGLAHPELLIFGLDTPTAAGVVNNLGRRVQRGEAILPGQLFTFKEWPRRVIPEEVPNPGEILFDANDYYHRPPEASVPALQLSYDDERGRFPWDAGYSTPELQPRPGTFRA